MENQKIEMIYAYTDSNVAPLLIEGITINNIPGSTVLPANCGIDLLNGHYEGENFLPPKWYEELMAKKDLKYNILVIDKITDISLDEQLKFVEILKYRKVSTFELPANCAIVVTCDQVNKDKISHQIYSLVAHI
jgi:hypothetical protein